MFRGTCIGLSEYLVQIPQKKRQQNNCLYATSYIMYFLFSQILDYSPRKYFPYASAALIAAHTVSGVTSNGIL